MIPITPDELARWRAEIDLGVEFRDKEFGTYRQSSPGSAPTTTLAGKNLDYFEQGARSDDFEPPLNLVYAIIKNVVPTLFFQNPRVTTLPEEQYEQAGEDAFYVMQLLNRDLRDPLLRIKETGQLSTFDGYVLASGLVKIGYATEFGQDILRTEREEQKRLRDKLKESVQSIVKTVLGQPQKPEEPEPEQVQADITIRSERPYIQWVSPFDFVIDPRARHITDARWVAQRIRRTLTEIKADRRYGKAKYELTPEAVDDVRVPESSIEDFQTADIWEVHYKTLDSPTGIRVLSFAATQTQTKPLLHDDNACDFGDWQYEWLAMNKHGHRLYPVSTISIIRPLIDRLNSSFDAILEQVDKFVSKLAYNERISPDAEMALDTPTIGARVKVSGTDDVRGAIAVISMEQVKQDMMLFINQVIDLIILITGLTRAQLTGLTTANTATEAQIGQSGQALRRTDESNVVADWFKRVIRKYWMAKSQFQDLTEVDLVKDMVTDPTSGILSAQWYPPIDQERADRLKQHRFLFDLEVSSMQKPNLEIIRAQYETTMRALMEPIVTQGLALDGKRISVQEAIRQWNLFFVEYGIRLDKLLVPVQDPNLQQALMTYGQKPEQTNGNGTAQVAGQVPTYADQVSAVAGERGQGLSPV
jgi:hypothetical protein